MRLNWLYEWHVSLCFKLVLVLVCFFAKISIILEWKIYLMTSKGSLLFSSFLILSLMWLQLYTLYNVHVPCFARALQTSWKVIFAEKKNSQVVWGPFASSASSVWRRFSKANHIRSVYVKWKLCWNKIIMSLIPHTGGRRGDGNIAWATPQQTTHVICPEVASGAQTLIQHPGCTVRACQHTRGLSALQTGSNGHSMQIVWTGFDLVQSSLIASALVFQYTPM